MDMQWLGRRDVAPTAAATTALGVAGAALLGALLLIWNQAQERIEVLRHEVSHTTISQADLLRTRLERSFAAAELLGAQVRLAGGELPEFTAHADALRNSLQGITNLQLAPDGVVRRIHPLEGHEGALGHDLLRDDRRSDAAWEAVQTRSMIVAGPFKLIQGGTGLVARQPVFLPTDNGGDRFWGFATALITMDDLLALSGLPKLADHGYSYRLASWQPGADEFRTFDGQEAVDQRYASSSEILLAGQRWRLEVWPSEAPGLIYSTLPLLALAMVASAILGAGTHRLLRRPAHLQRLVDQTTQALRLSTQRLTIEAEQRVLAEQRLQIRQRFLQHVINALPEPVLVLSPDGHLLDCNDAARQFTDPPGNSAKGARCYELMGCGGGCHHPADCPLMHQPGGTVHFSRDLMRNGQPATYDITFVRSSIEDNQGNASPVYVETWRDVTERATQERELRAQASRLEHGALHDALTGLANRLLYDNRLELALAGAQRTGAGLALITLDLDGFKPVNDRHGHHTGDAVLIELSRRLRACLRATDTSARVGGDEFAAIITDIHDPADAERVARQLLATLSAPYRIDGRDHAVGVSIGVALYPDDALDRHDLTRNADRAMYAAKQAGGNAIRFYGLDLSSTPVSA